MRLLAVAAAVIVFLTACGDVRRGAADNTGLGAMTAVTMQKTGCQLTCPAYTVRFMADGRARYDGREFAPRQGRFSAEFDFASLAEWIATQHPETLPDIGSTANIDGSAVNLAIDYGARRIRITGIDENSASLRLEGILLAIDGETTRMRWRRDDAVTPFFGTFRGGVTLNVRDDTVGSFFASTTPGCAQYRRDDAKVEGGALRLRCEARTSVLHVAGDDLLAQGDAIPPGRYVRLNPYAMSQGIRDFRPIRQRE